MFEYAQIPVKNVVLDKNTYLRCLTGALVLDQRIEPIWFGALCLSKAKSLLEVYIKYNLVAENDGIVYKLMTENPFQDRIRTPIYKTLEELCVYLSIIEPRQAEEVVLAIYCLHQCAAEEDHSERDFKSGVFAQTKSFGLSNKAINNAAVFVDAYFNTLEKLNIYAPNH